MEQSTRKQLLQIVTQLEALEEEKKSVTDNMKDIMDEAKAVGFDAKVIRKLIARRKLPKDDRDHEDDILHTYEHAIETVEDSGDE